MRGKSVMHTINIRLLHANVQGKTDCGKEVQVDEAFTGVIIFHSNSKQNTQISLLIHLNL